MGFSSSWIGTTCSLPKSLLKELDETMERERRQMMEKMARLRPGLNEFLKKGTQPMRDPSVFDELVLKNGWHIIWIERFEITSGNDDLLKRMSVNNRLVACFVEEHVMYSAAEEWKDGVNVWKVIHPAPGKESIVSGKLPSQYQSISDRLKTLEKVKRDADYLFDVPVELAASITGFRHDR
jgi:hypothetical protein